MDPDKRSAWLQKLDAECPYQVVLPRRQLTDDSEIVNFLLSYTGKFDMYVEDECAAYVRYCFKDPMDAAIFRSRFERKSDSFRLAGWRPPTAAPVLGPRAPIFQGSGGCDEAAGCA